MNVEYVDVKACEYLPLNYLLNMFFLLMIMIDHVQKSRCLVVSCGTIILVNILQCYLVSYSRGPGVCQH